MSDFLVYVRLPKYLRQWITHHLGDPVVFPNSSPQNSVIRTFLQKQPEATPYIPTPDDTAIAIPDSVSKPAHTYNYLGAMGRKAVVEAIKDLFGRSLWTDINPIIHSGVGLNKLIDAWCEKSGISIDYTESVRQCYYRVRKSYQEKGINLHNKSRVRTKKS